jgi:hypothetical protein
LFCRKVKAPAEAVTVKISAGASTHCFADLVFFKIEVYEKLRRDGSPFFATEGVVDKFSLDAMSRLPLCESVIRLFDYVMDAEVLAGVFDRHRGRSYERELSFSSFVYLISDALLEHRGSAHQAITRADEEGDLSVTMGAVYGKLRRIPITLSVGFLAETSTRLAELLPPATSSIPESLQEFKLIPIDGKKIKKAAKRLKPVRKVKGSVLGGKTLVAFDLQTRLVLGMNAHPDGEVNDAPLVPGLLEQLLPLSPGQKLFILDSQFCDLIQPQQFSQDGDHFLIRYHPKVSFHRDKSKKLRRGKDAEGRSYVEEWGWLGSENDKRRRYVRRITLNRKDEKNVILVTDLLDADTYSAVDLLAAYLMRWNIEKVFQKITEVFHLDSLIASTPEGTIFQCAFCMLLYNMIEVMRSYLAHSQKIDVEKISIENLFYDTHRQLIAWSELVGPTMTIEYFGPITERPTLQRRLKQLLASCWTNRWLKAAAKKKTRTPNQQAVPGGHTSIYRVLKKAKTKVP